VGLLFGVLVLYRSRVLAVGAGLGGHDGQKRGVTKGPAFESQFFQDQGPRHAEPGTFGLFLMVEEGVTPDQRARCVGDEVKLCAQL